MIVTEVDPNGPSYEQLFTPADNGPDIITAIEGKSVRTEADLKAAIRDAGKGAIVTLKVYNVRLERSRILRIRLQ